MFRATEVSLVFDPTWWFFGQAVLMSEAKRAYFVPFLLGQAWCWGSETKSSGAHFFLSPCWGSLSPSCATWGWRRGDTGNVKLSFLPFSLLLLLFLCDIQVWKSLICFLGKVFLCMGRWLNWCLCRSASAGRPILPSRRCWSSKKINQLLPLQSIFEDAYEHITEENLTSISANESHVSALYLSHEIVLLYEVL